VPDSLCSFGDLFEMSMFDYSVYHFGRCPQISLTLGLNSMRRLLYARFEGLAEVLKDPKFEDLDSKPFKGRTWRGADMVVISNDAETRDLYKNYSKEHWSQAGDFVLATRFPKAVDRMLRKMRDVVQPHQFMHKDDFYPEVARAIARCELGLDVSWSDVVDSAVACARMLWQESKDLNRSAPEIWTTFRCVGPDIALDIETSSLSEQDGEIIEIHAVELDNRGGEPRRLDLVVRPTQPLSAAVQQFLGISNSSLAQHPYFREIADLFLGFVGNSTLFCVNAAFDMQFLNKELVRAGCLALADARFHELRRSVPAEYRARGTAGIAEFAGVDSGDRLRTGVDLVAALYRKIQIGRLES
jgi:hypothetical protein